MKIGILSDAHGNADGLKICIEFFIKNDVQKIYFLGDAIGYLPEWKMVLDLLKRHSLQCLMGNHEAMMLGLLPLSEEKDLIYRIEENKIKLTTHEIKYISKWETYLQETICQKRILFCHGSPDNYLGGYVYSDTDVRHFADLNFDIIFMGNSHYPFVRNVNGITIVNVGSCGLPRDVGNIASCAIYDFEKETCQIFRLNFDVYKIIEKHKDLISDSVVQCLLRRRADFVGRIVEVR